MRAISIKLPDELHDDLKAEAAATGRSIAAVVRQKLSAQQVADHSSVYACTADLAGSLDGGSIAATNSRPKFKRR